MPILITRHCRVLFRTFMFRQMIIGINAKSKNIDTAKEFYAFALSADGQKAIDSYSGFPVNKERFDASLVDPDAGTEGYDPNAVQRQLGHDG